MAKTILHVYAPGQYAPQHAPVGQIRRVLSATAVVAQADKFDNHAVEISDSERAAVLALPPFSTIDIEEEGLGIVARGRVTSPSLQVKETGEGTITLDLPNITDECRDVTTGLRYVDSEGVGQIAANLGALTTVGESILTGYDAYGRAITTVVPGQATGWFATYRDDGTYVNSVAPVQWAYFPNCTPNGNTLTKNMQTQSVYTDGGAGLPKHTDPTVHDCALQWQIVTPVSAVVGLSAAPFPFVTFGFFLTPGTWQVQELGGVPAGTGTSSGTYTANTAFNVAVQGGAVKYYVNNSLVFTSATLPNQGALQPVAAIATPGGAVTNAVFARTVPGSELWWAARYDGLSQLGALQQLTKDTGLHLRQARDAYGAPARGFEVGAFGAPSTLRLVDGRGGDLAKLLANPAIRVIDTIDVTTNTDNVITVTTPLGSGTGDTQVSVELLWRILHDPTYADYGKYGTAQGSVFPEYDPQYTLHRVATSGGGYEYYLRSQPGIQFLKNLGHPTGEIRGGQPDSQFAYPAQATEAQQQLVQRALYVATLAKFKRGDHPLVTLSVVTVTNVQAYPPGAADLVHVDYSRVKSDTVGTFVPLAIDDDYFAMKLEREYASDGVVREHWTLSNLPRYEQDQGTRTATMERQLAAVQLTTTTNQSVERFFFFRDFDAGDQTHDHSIVVPLKILPTVYRVTACYVRFDFYPFRQTGTLTNSGPHSHKVVIPDHTHAPATGLATDTGGFDQPNLFLWLQETDHAPGDPVYAYRDAQNTFDGLHVSNVSGTSYTIKVSAGANHDPALTAATTAHPHTFADTSHITDTHQFDPITTEAIVQTSNDGDHTHTILAGVVDGLMPAAVQLLIDSGDGAFVDRSPVLLDSLSNLVGPYTATGEVECSKYINAPGRTPRLKFTSIASAANPKGLGALGISVVMVEEYGGLGTTVTQQQ